MRFWHGRPSQLSRLVYSTGSSYIVYGVEYGSVKGTDEGRAYGTVSEGEGFLELGLMRRALRQGTREH